MQLPMVSKHELVLYGFSVTNLTKYVNSIGNNIHVSVNAENFFPIG